VQIIKFNRANQIASCAAIWLAEWTTLERVLTTRGLFQKETL